MNINIEPIRIPPDAEFSRVYNNNNHWPGSVKPADYDWRLGLTHTKNWIDALKPNYSQITIESPTHIQWLREANKIGRQTGRFPEAFRDELDDFLAKHRYYTTIKKFVRCNDVSLKHGQHGVGPYTGLREMIESAVTCRAGHSPFDHETQTLHFYLIDWVDLNPHQEFRVFVHNNQLTCISQQSCYTPNSVLLALATDDERNELITEWVSVINTYWETTIKPRVTFIPDCSYTIDMAILDSKTPYFIELNCFGKEYAAGSALFNWIIDEDKLYGKEENIFFRFGV